MSLIDETSDVASEMIGAAGEVTATATDLAIGGAQAALGSSRRLKSSMVAIIVLLATSALGYRWWRSRGGQDESSSDTAQPLGSSDGAGAAERRSA